MIYSRLLYVLFLCFIANVKLKVVEVRKITHKLTSLQRYFRMEDTEGIIANGVLANTYMALTIHKV